MSFEEGGLWVCLGGKEVVLLPEPWGWGPGRVQHPQGSSSHLQGTQS